MAAPRLDFVDIELLDYVCSKILQLDASIAALALCSYDKFAEGVGRDSDPPSWFEWKLDCRSRGCIMVQARQEPPPRRDCCRLR